MSLPTDTSSASPETTQFTGFASPQENWSKLPHQFIAMLPDFSEAELRVVLYILRHTWGYGEYEQLKKITLDEFEFGRKDKHGGRLDRGCGVQRKAIERGLDRAIEHGFIAVEMDDTDKARIKKYYGIRMLDVTQEGLKDRSDDLKDSSDDLKDRSSESLRPPDQRKILKKETLKKEKEIEAPAPDPVIIPETRTLPESDPDELARLEGAKAVKARLTAEERQSAAPETIAMSFSVARRLNREYGGALLGMTSDKHPYWQAYQTATAGLGASQKDTTPSVSTFQFIQELTNMDVIPEELTEIVSVHLAKRRSTAPYRFEYVPGDIRQARERRNRPPRDGTLLEAVCAVWNMKAGEEIAERITDYLQGVTSDEMYGTDWERIRLIRPSAPDETKAFGQWYKNDPRFKSQIHPPTTPLNIKNKIEEFRATRPVVSAGARQTFTPLPSAQPLTTDQLLERERIKREILGRRQGEGVLS